VPPAFSKKAQAPSMPSGRRVSKKANFARAFKATAVAAAGGPGTASP